MIIDPKTLIGKFKISYQYIDYEENEWTAPTLLTKEKLKEVFDDGSVSKVRLFPTDDFKCLEFDIN